jgi:hypothetical protein
MKITVKQAIELLSKHNPDSEILMWYRTSEDVGANTEEWSELEDDSEGIEDTIDEYVNGWLDEIRE